MSELRLTDVVAALVATRDRLQEKVGHADVAIEALGKLLTDDGAPVPTRALPAAPRAPRSTPAAATGATDRKGHRVYGDERPRTAVCRNEQCGNAFPVKGPGRVPHYCSDVCRTAAGKRLRAAIATKAAPATPTPVPEREVLRAAADPIPESGAGMKARIAHLAGGDAMPRSRFLESARGRNEEAARRSARTR